MPVPGAIEKIRTSVMEWEGIALQLHRFGGIEFNLGNREIGHVHGNYLVDIPFTKKVKNEIISAGLANHHHVLPESGWISKYLNKPEDVDDAIQLLRRSYDIALIRKRRKTVKN